MAYRTVAPLLTALLAACVFDQNPDFDGPASASSSTGDESVGATSTTDATSTTTDATSTTAATTTATASSDPTASTTDETDSTTLPATSTGDPALCGNGIQEEGEECDDGNNIPDDGCDGCAKSGFCGDGKLGPGEECDLGDGNGMGKACTAACLLNLCGDGDKGPDEVCDDGNDNNEDLCSTDCLPVPIDVAFEPALTWIPPIGNAMALYNKLAFCPLGSALVGFHARTNLLGKWVVWLKPVCADLYVLPKGAGYAIHTDVPQPVGGGIGEYVLEDPDYESICSPSQVVFGATAGFKDDLGKFALKCTFLDVVAGDTKYGVSYGMQQDLQPVGAGPAGMNNFGVCPPGQVVTAVEIGYEIGIRYLRLGCQQPILVHK